MSPVAARRPTGGEEESWAGQWRGGGGDVELQAAVLLVRGRRVCSGEEVGNERRKILLRR
jgi:hypothetical protein